MGTPWEDPAFLLKLIAALPWPAVVLLLLGRELIRSARGAGAWIERAVLALERLAESRAPAPYDGRERRKS